MEEQIMATLKTRDIWLLAQDPVHVGTGGIQLSHVDLQIVRDPADNLPRIPATTLAGNIRTGAARFWENKEKKEKKNLSCAGVGTREEPHCGECPVCHAFGTSRENQERMGALSFADARLFLFPLYSFTHGPIWITSHSRAAMAPKNTFNLPDRCDDDKVYFSANTSLLALGRRLLTLPNNNPTVSLALPQGLTAGGGLKTALVPDDLFSMLVNENLEVRTSVSIDPLKGAARSGALFTYEALPRASILLGRVTLDENRWQPEAGTGTPWPDPFTLVEEGGKPLALVGLGGMTSRGFGRVNMICGEVE